jgi:hypothetical protein
MNDDPYDDPNDDPMEVEEGEGGDEDMMDEINLSQQEQQLISENRWDDLAHYMPTGPTGETIIDICKIIPPHILNPETGKGKIAYLNYGRFQPPHTGHRALFKGMVYEAMDCPLDAQEGKVQKHFNSHYLNNADHNNNGISTNVFVFASNTGGPDWCPRQSAARCAKNPLDPRDKVDLLYLQNYNLHGFPNTLPLFFINSNLMDKPKSILGAIKVLSVCYDKVAVRVGSDQVKNFQWLSKTSVGELIDSISTPPGVIERDESSTHHIFGMSSSKVRKHAVLSVYADSPNERKENEKKVSDAIQPQGSAVSDIRVKNTINEIVDAHNKTLPPVTSSGKVGGNKRRNKSKRKRKTKRKRKRKTKRKRKRKTKRKRKRKTR